MKRYMIFAGDMFYPDGGMEDYRGSWDDLPQAAVCAREMQSQQQFNWWHIFDTIEHKIAISWWARDNKQTYFDRLQHIVGGEK